MDDIIHLLVIAADHFCANELISRLRNCGLAARAAPACDPMTLRHQLTQACWDLVLYCDKAAGSPAQVRAELDSRNLALPMLFIGEISCPEDSGAAVSAVLNPADVEGICHCIQREAELQRLRRNLTLLQLENEALESSVRALLDHSPLACACIQDGIHQYCNQSYADLFGYPLEQVATLPFLDLFAVASQGRLKDLLLSDLRESASVKVQGRLASTEEATMRLVFRPVPFLGRKCLQVEVSCRSGNHDHQSGLEALQARDLLTRLENRQRFISRLDSAIYKAVSEDTDSALLLIEINEFLDISSTIGKARANMVVRDVANYLQEAVRLPYAAARLDFNLFAILLYDSDPDTAIALASEIRSNIHRSIAPGMLSSIVLTCSIGLVLVNRYSTDSATLLEQAAQGFQCADAILEERGNFHSPSLQQNRTRQLLGCLRQALEHKRIDPLYQPLVHLQGDRHPGYEARMTLQDEAGNALAPGTFLPVANMHGMGESLDRLLVTATLTALPEIDTRLALLLGVSPNTLLSQHFVPWLSEQLLERRIPANRLLLQLSEIDIYIHRPYVIDFCRNLQELGIGIVFGQFGCAPDPFAIFQDIRPDLVKFEVTLIRDILYSTRQKKTLEALVGALHDENVQVIAPQVDALPLLQALTTAGVDFAQGMCLQAPASTMDYEFVFEKEITLAARQF